MIRRLTLERASLLLIVGFVIHNADHARRGLDSVRDGVVWGGTLLLVVTAVVLTLVFVGHHRAPAAAAVLGPTIVVGVCAAHLPPDWGPLSDPLITGDVGTVSLIAAGTEVVAAAIFGFVAWRILRSHDYAFAVPRSTW